MINKKYTVVLAALLMQSAIVFGNVDSEIAQKEAARTIGAVLVALEAHELVEVNDLAGNDGAQAQQVVVEKLEEDAAEIANVLEIAEVVTQEVAQ